MGTLARNGLKQPQLGFFWHFCPRVSLKVMLSLYLISYQFQLAVAYKTCLKRKRVVTTEGFQKIHKNEIISCSHAPCYDGNTCHWQSIC